MAHFEPLYAYVILPSTVINWQALAFNSFWIVGLAILFAAFSYHYWAAHETQTSLKIQLNRPSFLAYFWLSFVFVCVGLAGTSQPLWEMIVWVTFAGLGILFLVKAVVLYRSERLKIGEE